MVVDDTLTLEQRIGHFTRRLDFGPGGLATITGFTTPPVWLAATQQWLVQIAGASLFPSGNQAASYALTPFLAVTRDDAVGDMIVDSGQLLVLGDTAFDLSGFDAERGQTLVGPAGITTDEICIQLPPGIGWRGGSTGLLAKELCANPAGGIALDSETLLPSQTFTGVFAGGAPEVVADAFPLLFDADVWTYLPASGDLQIPTPDNVRFSDSFAYSLSLDVPRANNSVWRTIQPLALSPLTISAGAGGGISVVVNIGGTGGIGFGMMFPRGSTQHAGGQPRSETTAWYRGLRNSPARSPPSDTRASARRAQAKSTPTRIRSGRFRSSLATCR